MEAGMWTNRTTHLAGVALSALILTWQLASAASVHAQSGDVTSVLKDFHAALNAGDVDGSLAFFADDGVADIQGDIYRGKDALREWLNNDISHHIHVEMLNLQVAGNRATWTARLKVDALSEPIELASNAVVEQGKIVSFAALPMDAPVGTQMPATGSTSALPSLWLLLLMSLVLLGLGVTLRQHAGSQA